MHPVQISSKFDLTNPSCNCTYGRQVITTLDFFTAMTQHVSSLLLFTMTSSTTRSSERIWHSTYDISAQNDLVWLLTQHSMNTSFYLFSFPFLSPPSWKVEFTYFQSSQYSSKFAGLCIEHMHFCCCFITGLQEAQ